ncbi:hypothetical protein P4A93_01565 [Pseudomonas syringae pv. syringae]|uniref:hypothetical protein n=1 Tax=Pseudomonas syringae TaxID=317 RepID=UPI0023F7A966|nr:hypothetical protein [Pseudomonas syringae]MDF5890314.1 hypothetical protein [Pseudomonas syringae pv. syringae]
MLAALPMAMLYIDAPLSTLKTAVVLAVIPFMFVLVVVMVVSLFRWLREDYGSMCGYQIVEQSRQMALEQLCVPRSQLQMIPFLSQNWRLGHRTGLRGRSYDEAPRDEAGRGRLVRC